MEPRWLDGTAKHVDVELIGLDCDLEHASDTAMVVGMGDVHGMDIGMGLERTVVFT
jgi:hypothetical protein